ncbi:S26 family signal peptidase [Candidatus Peribacteria bacterium]|nr:S26 family signal peptidase [Candidatus Peribacteria bacterium]
MSPTLSPESLVIIDKISSRVFPPKRSEIIVYRNEQK